MTVFSVPTRDEVTPDNQALFDNLKKALGFVPNLFATFALSPTALGAYLTLQNGKSSLKPKEREVINLAVSQVNNCDYCLAAHTALGKMLGFTEAQIAELRRGRASFDAKTRSPASRELSRSIGDRYRQRPPTLSSRPAGHKSISWTRSWSSATRRSAIICMA
jgi:AhpD family alkylhydroperoxidase